MNKATLLAAAATIALVATPALAQDSVQPRSNVHAKSYKMRHHGTHHARMMRSDDRFAQRDARGEWNRGDWNRDDWNHRSGFWPADTTAGIAGSAMSTAGAIASSAVNTAGSIATAPFRGPYDNGYYGRNDRSYGDYAYRSGYDGNGYPYGNRYRYGDTFASMDEGYSTYSYNGIAVPGSSNFDARNGFTCRPGSVTKLANGRTTICQ